MDGEVPARTVAHREAINLITRNEIKFRDFLWGRVTVWNLFYHVKIQERNFNQLNSFYGLNTLFE